MASKNRAYRFAQTLQETLAKIIALEVRDPRLDIITITDVEVSSDLSSAKIYVVSRNNDKTEESVTILNKAAGFVRRRLGKEMIMRAIPELAFRIDQSHQHGQRIDSLLSDISLDSTDDETKH